MTEDPEIIPGIYILMTEDPEIIPDIYGLMVDDPEVLPGICIVITEILKSYRTYTVLW